ncbi:MAG: hypothetical protein JZD41_07690 [Thermoproteus sp.]|nr:hypothetical protein [Thermoproteus sp.]
MIVTRIKARRDGCGYVVDNITMRDGYIVEVKRWFCVERGQIVYPVRSSLSMDVFAWASAYEVN